MDHSPGTEESHDPNASSDQQPTASVQPSGTPPHPSPFGTNGCLVHSNTVDPDHTAEDDQSLPRRQPNRLQTITNQRRNPDMTAHNLQTGSQRGRSVRCSSQRFQNIRSAADSQPPSSVHSNGPVNSSSGNNPLPTEGSLRINQPAASQQPTIEVAHSTTTSSRTLPSVTSSRQSTSGTVQPSSVHLDGHSNGDTFVDIAQPSSGPWYEVLQSTRASEDGVVYTIARLYENGPVCAVLDLPSRELASQNQPAGPSREGSFVSLQPSNASSYRPAQHPGFPAYRPSQNPGAPAYRPSQNPGAPAYWPTQHPGFPAYGPSQYPGAPAYGPSQNCCFSNLSVPSQRPSSPLAQNCCFSNLSVPSQRPSSPLAQNCCFSNLSVPSQRPSSPHTQNCCFSNPSVPSQQPSSPHTQNCCFSNPSVPSQRPSSPHTQNCCFSNLSVPSQQPSSTPLQNCISNNRLAQVQQSSTTTVSHSPSQPSSTPPCSSNSQNTFSTNSSSGNGGTCHCRCIQRNCPATLPTRNNNSPYPGSTSPYRISSPSQHSTSSHTSQAAASRSHPIPLQLRLAENFFVPLIGTHTEHHDAVTQVIGHYEMPWVWKRLIDPLSNENSFSQTIFYIVSDFCRLCESSSRHFYTEFLTVDLDEDILNQMVSYMGEV